MQNNKKLISVTIPCYNDSAAVEEMHTRLVKVFETELPAYDYEIIYVDDHSPDETWAEIEKVCAVDDKVKGVRNLNNFGLSRNLYATLSYGAGDAVFALFGDLQDPPETLPDAVELWENGAKVVGIVRKNTFDKGLLALGRKAYYWIAKKFFQRPLIKGFAGSGLYDKSIIDTIRSIEDVQPYISGIIAEYVKDTQIVEVEQQESKRESGNWSFFRKYDYAMTSLTAYSKMLLRICTFIGAFVGVFSIIMAIIVVVQKLLYWDEFALGLPTILVGMFFLGAVQLFFLGILGEYVLSINERSIKRPVVVIQESINMDDEQFETVKNKHE
ncbi:MAG: glycosyltransferase family 2 protein [Bifidobacteriaceae bacterium]|jgi:glycosyltransferase involved in cell wall biosynthesis|nr:glycosyltransferase family 2 protein [Bifidobacteriaceae bacterium]